MILEWIEYDTLKTEEQLVNVIYDCGMATFGQLQTITGWSERQLRSRITSLYKLNKKEASTDSEEKAWLQTHYTSRQSKGAVYTLGPSALKYVHQLREDNNKASQAKFGQLVHYVKTNDILVRTLRDFERSKLRWFSSYETTDMLFIRWNQVSNKKLNRRTSIRPDAKLYIRDTPYYIEFDNATEGPRQVERKFHAYVEMLLEIKDRSPVIWVTTNTKRKEYLQRNWEALRRISYSDFERVPEMFFFTEGEETDFLCQRHKEIPPLRSRII